METKDSVRISGDIQVAESHELAGCLNAMYQSLKTSSASVKAERSPAEKPGPPNTPVEYKSAELTDVVVTLADSSSVAAMIAATAMVLKQFRGLKLIFNYRGQELFSVSGTDQPSPGSVEERLPVEVVASGGLDAIVTKVDSDSGAVR